MPSTIDNTVYDDKLKDIMAIGQNQLPSKLRVNAHNNVKGALIGGIVGIVLGIASKQNVYIAGGVGVVLGRLFLSKKVD